MEEAANAPYYLDASANGTIVISELDVVRFRRFKVYGHTEDIIVTYEPQIETNDIWRELVIENQEAYSVTLQAASSPGLIAVIPRNSSYIVSLEGVDAKVTGESGIIKSVPFSIGVFAAGVPVSDTEIMRYPFIESVAFPIDFADSQISVGVAPAVPVTIYVRNGVTDIGTIEIDATGAGVFSAVSESTFAVGEPLVLHYYAHAHGTVTFTAVADNGDTLTIDDGVNTPVTFTFGGGGGQVAPGVSNIASATNLETAIGAALLDVVVTRNSNVLTIKKNNFATGLGGITKSDGDNDFTVVDFAEDTIGGNIGISLAGTRI